MKRFFKQFVLRRCKSAAAIFLAVLLLSACDEAVVPSSSAYGWPDGLSVPIRNATFSMAEEHLPGASFSYRDGAHQGFDFFNAFSGRLLAFNEPVVAVADGEIIRIDHVYEERSDEQLSYYAQISAESGFPGDYALDQLRGRQVWIRHESGHVSRYAHLSGVHPELQPGSAVLQGQAVGLMGNSGIPPAENQPRPAPHLHFEFWTPDGSRYLGQGMTTLESHRAIASVFSEDALPRYARRIVSQVEAGQEPPEFYPPEDLPSIEFQVDAPSYVSAGNAFAIPVFWAEAELSVQDFFATLEGRPLGLIDAGNGAWILGAVPLQSAGKDLNLTVGATDAFGRTISGQSTLQAPGPAMVIEAREVEPAVLDRYTDQNRQIEAARLGPIHEQSLNLRVAQWREPFQPPVAGDVVATFGQPAVHGVRKPAYPLPGIEIEPSAENADIRAANAGIVALIEELPIRGKTVALAHGGGVVTIYSRLDRILVSVGEQVDRGQPLAKAPSPSGGSDAIQAEIHVAGIPSNPAGWLDQILPVASPASEN